MSKVTLGQVAMEVRESTKDPTGLPIVGLEHLVPGELQLTQWSESSENTFTKLFHKGQVLFGRRRAYQKKAVVADFDGVCSGDITVIAARPDRLLPDLLPFIVSDDRFFDFAMEKSAGSLSPRVKWAQLAEYTFDLPDDMEEQRRLSTLLWAMERNRVAYQNLLMQMDELVKSQFVEMFGDYRPGTIQWPEYTLQKLIDMGWITYHLDGNHGGEYPRADEFVDSGVPYISANCIIDGAVSFSNAKYVTDERSKRFRKGIAQNNDVLFAHNATVGPVAILKTKVPTVILGTSLTAFRCDMHSLIPEYLKAYLENPYFIRQYEGEMQQSTRKQVPITTQRKYTIVVPDLETQERFSCFIHQTDKSKYDSKVNLDDAWIGGDMCA